jgi:hypothetical protein
MTTIGLRIGLCGIVLSMLGASANAELLGIYEFTGTPTGNNQFNQATSPHAAGMFSSFTRSPSLAFAPGANIFNSGSWNRFAGDLPSHSTFSFTVNDPYEVQLQALTFDFGRNQFGPTSGTIQISTDGFQTSQTVTFFDLAQGTSLGGTLTYQHGGVYTGNVVWTLDDLALNPGETIQFRFFGQGAALNKGNMWFDNVALYASQVPGPTPVILCGLGLSLVVMARRRFAPT